MYFPLYLYCYFAVVLVTYFVIDDLLPEASYDPKIILCLLMEVDEDEIQQKREKRDALFSAQMKLLLLLASNSTPEEKKKEVWLSKKAEILQGVDKDGNLFFIYIVT